MLLSLVFFNLAMLGVPSRALLGLSICTVLPLVATEGISESFAPAPQAMELNPAAETAYNQYVNISREAL